MSEEIKQNNSIKQNEHTPDSNIPKHFEADFLNGSQVGLNPQQQRDKKSQEIAETIVNQKWFRIYWALFLILCIVLIESFFKSGIALGTVIWFALAEVIAIFFAKYSTGKLNKKTLLLCLPIALINMGHLLFHCVSIQIITWPVALLLFALQLTYLSKPERDKFSELFDLNNIYDVLNTIFLNAFVYITYPFKGLFKFSKEKNKGVVGHVLIGILISLPIVGIFIGLFSSADQSFATFVSNFTKSLSSNFGGFINNLIVGAIMCIFVSAAFVGANARELASEPLEKTAKEANNVTLGTILVMVAMIVALYVGIQFNHWFGNIPLNYIQMDEYSISARTGFFELVVASCFLLALITTVTMISTKRHNQLVPVIKAPLLLLCACNLIVLYSAIEKMAIYIGRSGITTNRILVLWFIAVIVVCMAGIIIKIMRFSLKTFKYCCVAVTALVCVLSFCNLDYYVAKNHIYLAEHQKIQNLEWNMLYGLSYAAAKPIAEYKIRIENGESAFYTTRMQSQSEVLSILDKELRRHRSNIDLSIEENPIMGFNFSRHSAQSALKYLE